MPLIPAMLSALMLLQSASADFARAETERLEACIAKIETAPEDAYEDGLAWTFQGNRPGARQCTALALIALGHEEEGAARLYALANASDGGTLEQRAVYLSQAGHAWLQAGAAEAAATAFSDALRLAPDMSDLLTDRAMAYILSEKWNEALPDLDSVITRRPQDVLARQMRAETHLNLEQYELAMADVTAAMAAEPGNIDTLLIRGRIREAMRLAAEYSAVVQIP